MKRWKRWVAAWMIALVVCLLLGVLTAGATDIVAEGECGLYGGHLTWQLNSEGTLTIRGNGRMKDNFNRSAPWYDYHSQIKSVVFEQSTENISCDSFIDCENLTSVSLPYGLKKIQGGAFEGCISLTQIAIPETVTVISVGAFKNCAALTSLELPASLVDFDGTDFEGCTALTAIHVAADNPKFSSDAQGALYNKDKTELLAYPRGRAGDYAIADTTQEVSVNAFSGCVKLETITVPESVTLIGYPKSEEEVWYNFRNPFTGCSALTAIHVAEGNEYYSSDEAGVLYNKDKTTLVHCPDRFTGEYVVPDGVTCIKIEAFKNCSGLTSVVLPEGLKDLQGGVFENCTGLTEIDIPDSVSMLGGYTFAGCTGLTDVTIPESETGVAGSLFKNCSSLTTLRLPSGIKNFGTDAVSGCPLEAIYIPSVEDWLSITFGYYSTPLRGRAALYVDGKPLTEVVIPEGTKTLKKFAFYGCTSLERITIPASVTTIESFALHGCTALTNICVAEDNPNYYTDEQGVLFDKEGKTLLCFPAGYTGEYTTPEHIDTIDYFAFAGCSNLTGITITEGVFPRFSAFQNCSSLKYASLPESLTGLAWDMFNNCPELEYIVIPSGIRIIDDGAFRGCKSLKAVCFKGAPPEISESAFLTDDFSVGAGKRIPGLTFYYIEGTEGWTTPEWNGYPTATWDGVNVPHTHKYQSVLTAPTCTEKGYATYTCAICEDSYVADEVAALGHDLVTDAAIAVTCTESGLTEGKHCSRCDYKIERQAIAALGHAWDAGKVTTAPTTEKEGVRTFTCTRCELTRTEPIDKLQATVSFKDVDEKAYYAAAVEWAVAQNITKGTASDTFAPNDTCTRGQIVTFLWRAAGEPKPSGTKNPFTDVKQGDYWYNAVLWAVEQGITTGTSATTFSPNEGCTRGQVATFLWRYENKPTPAAKNPFEDVKQGAYYYDAVLWAVEADVTKGTSATTFAPNDTCTRGQIVTFLYRDIA